MLNKKEQEKIDKKVQKVTNKALYWLVGIAPLVMIALLYFFNQWSFNNKIVLQFPIILRTPIKIERRNTALELPKDGPIKVVEAVKPTEAPDVLDDYVEQAYKTVHFHESNYGKDKTGLNGYCIARGEVNEVGYSPHTKYCFKDTTEQHEMVKLWFKNRVTGVKPGICIDIETCLSVYSNGAYSEISYQ